MDKTINGTGFFSLLFVVTCIRLIAEAGTFIQYIFKKISAWIYYFGEYMYMYINPQYMRVWMEYINLAIDGLIL